MVGLIVAIVLVVVIVLVLATSIRIVRQATGVVVATGKNTEIGRFAICCFSI